MNKTLISIVALTLTACTKDASTSANHGDTGLGRSVSGQEPGTHGKDTPRETSNELATSFDYFDGADKRTVWLSTDLVAEFGPTDSGRDALLRSDPAGQEVPQGQKSVRLWRVRATQGTDALTRGLNSGASRFSPVLHDGPSTTLPLRSLPGGVVASFQPSWDRARIDAWLAARGLTITSEVIAGGNVFEVSTPPGLEAITIANQLYATGELVACTPNFWQQFSTR